VNGVPVANYAEDKQEKSDQQQASGFRGIGRMATMLVIGLVG